MPGQERARTLSVQRPQPHTTNPWKEERENSRRQKRKSRSCQQESIGSALETRHSHTIKHWVTKIVRKRHREEHKGSAILRNPTAWGCERVPMSNQSTTRNTHWHIRQRQCTYGTYGKGNAPLKGCIGLLLILNRMDNSATD